MNKEDESMVVKDGIAHGYKVHYDGEKFVADTSLSAAEKVPDDSTIVWFDYVDSAEHTARINNIKNHIDFEVKKCKSCGEYFIQTLDERAWYECRDLKPPVRCATCREIRKSLKNK